MQFDVSRAPGSRVRSLQILCTSCRVPRYRPVEDAEVYAVAVPGYLVSGGDGYAVIADEMIHHSSGERSGGGRFWWAQQNLHRWSSPSAGDLDLSVVSRYISQRKLVFPAVEGRISFYSSASGPGPGPGPGPALVLLGSLVLLRSV